MTHWPALERWQHPEYLLAVAGQRTVPVELGKHYLAEGWGQSLISLGDFLRRHVMEAGLLLLRCSLIDTFVSWWMRVVRCTLYRCGGSMGYIRHMCKRYGAFLKVPAALRAADTHACF